MNAVKNDLNPDKLRQDIIDAAYDRFLLYGFGKTTMAEIAEDVSMSAANLYRYFQNKQDIASACANMCMSVHHNHLREAIRSKPLSAAERLHTFAIEAYRHNMSMMKNTPKANELVQVVTSNNPEMIVHNVKAQVALISEILAYGNETGEFDIDDVVKQADTIYSTLLLFDVPIFLLLFTREQFEDKAKNIVMLIVEGIRKR